MSKSAASAAMSAPLPGDHTHPTITKAMEDKIYADRIERIKKILDYYGDTNMETEDMLGHRDLKSKPHQYVLLTHGRDGRYWCGCATVSDARDRAAELVQDDYPNNPTCYFDLDELAGDPPSPCEGDRVHYEDDTWWITHVHDDVADGMVFHKLYLDKSKAAFIDSQHTDVDETDVEIIERAFPDDRLPVKFDVADVVVSVVFNTVPAS